MDWDTSPALPVRLDILIDILLFLPLDSVLALRRTSKSLCAVTRLRTLWAIFFSRHVIDRCIPYPHTDTPIGDLSAAELEYLTLRASSLHRNWTSPRPVPHRQLMFNSSTEPSARIIFLQFLPARANRWLISVRMTARSRRYLLQCWDIACDQPRCVAELLHVGPYGGVVLNSDPHSSAVLALQTAQTETFSIDFDAQDTESAFITEQAIDGIRELHLLSGSTLVTRSIGDGGPLCLWDLSDLAQEKLQLLNPSLIPVSPHTQSDDCVRAIHLAHDYALVVRLQAIEIYNTTPRPGILPVHRAPIAYPLAQFRFQWPTDTVVLCEHGPDSPLSPIHLLVRFGSTHPWPVNALHHYVLRPNPAYLAGARSAPVSPLSPITPSSSSSSLPLTPTTEYNLPYALSPTLTHIIASPVRLFGRSAMTLGRYGTALWIDSDTELGGPSEGGQRVVGRVVRGGGDAAGADSHRNKAWESEVESCGASMVFSMRGDDGWTHVAMEENAGRIALGHSDGAITLLEY